MKKAPCGRTWEVEAIEDGRLSGSELSSFRRHAATCNVCAEEIAALAKLRVLGRSLVVEPRSDLDHRRERAALLSRANVETLSGSRGASTVRFAAIGVAATIVLLLGVFAATRALHRPAPVIASSAPASAAPSWEVANLGTAVWSIEQDGPHTHLRLSSGTARFRVDRLATSQRFVVRVPDGEVEVRGTRFVVHVAGARTLDVRVEEGAVALRIDGEPDRMIAAGAAWSRPNPQSEPMASSSSATTTSSPPSVAPIPTIVASKAPAAAAKSAPEPKTFAFAAAMQAFQAGKFPEADALFAKFIADSPSDPRCEDAAFLRAVCHERSGDAAGAAALAREYLDRHPKGLRRPEAEALAKAAP